MNRRQVLLSSAIAIIAARAAHAAEAESVDRSALLSALGDPVHIDAMLYAVDALRLNLALAQDEPEAAAVGLADGHPLYQRIYQAIQAAAPKLVDDIKGLDDAALQLSGELIAIVQRSQKIVTEGGVSEGSRIYRVMFVNFRLFLKSAELSGADLKTWLCQDYPFKAACG